MSFCSCIGKGKTNYNNQYLGASGITTVRKEMSSLPSSTIPDVLPPPPPIVLDQTSASAPRPSIAPQHQQRSHQYPPHYQQQRPYQHRPIAPQQSTPSTVVPRPIPPPVTSPPPQVPSDAGVKWGSRSVDVYTKLEQVGEGTYGFSLDISYF